MKRDVTQTIWRTVVFAGAMLGAPACSKKQANTTPSNTATTPAGTDTAAGSDAAKPDDQMATPAAGDTTSQDPCGGERPRGADDDGGGGVGRGFVLS
jgi:hypothetical protein